MYQKFKSYFKLLGFKNKIFAQNIIHDEGSNITGNHFGSDRIFKKQLKKKKIN